MARSCITTSPHLEDVRARGAKDIADVVARAAGLLQALDAYADFQGIRGIPRLQDLEASLRERFHDSRTLLSGDQDHLGFVQLKRS